MYTGISCVYMCKCMFTSVCKCMCVDTCERKKMYVCMKFENITDVTRLHITNQK